MAINLTKGIHCLNNFRVYDYRSFKEIFEGIRENLDVSSDSGKIRALADFEGLVCWHQTMNDIPALIKCLLFNYFMRHIFIEGYLFLLIGSELTKSLLVEQGYSWVCYIKFSFPEREKINPWLRNALSEFENQQLILRRKLDKYGSASELAIHDQLLINVIENHKGITTRSIVRKVGKPEATVRRMLVKLRQLKYISTSGKGRSIGHTFVSI